MSISQKTTIQAYQLKAGGVRARMAILRMIAADSVHNRNESTRLQPGDWKAARRYSLKTYAAAYISGINKGGDSWYSHEGEQFRNERDAHEVTRMDHTGWYTDADGHERAIGIVASLPHGRFIAGYRWTSNDERVYFGEVFDNERDAALSADGHAERFADGARADDGRFRAMADCEGRVESVESDVRNAYDARNVSNFWREHCRERIAELRAAREEFARARHEYENAGD